ncbi:Arc-like DNA binding domain-containing protein [Pseudomonas sp. LAMO17WK12:I6]|uniref:Arc family DNA-binding protein n=1 Tax=unclassified Pseudomonas TaxID=196821 RepID=UPI000BCA90D1|nr:MULTISPECIES: Arc family DNA-binding protein [unclassified Pseudomonas]SNY42429.1 Arc-like DNA binding domain-containing protein [Pseudomonas sp. LAMO17WK12:I6]SNY43644.1 Arc-like DNA binding domain-containing protein [Pseudomonas sp. LAMO17WK12:I5]
MSRVDLQVNFRMPASLKDELEALAKRNRRSLTAEIVARLERSISDTDEMGISDRDRMNPEHPFYLPATEQMPITRGVSKEKLLAPLDQERPVTKKDLNEAVMEAMLTVMNALKDGPPGSNETAKGPKSRKKFPKE